MRAWAIRAYGEPMQQLELPMPHAGSVPIVGLTAHETLNTSCVPTAIGWGGSRP
jgi:hypothetical protein